MSVTIVNTGANSDPTNTPWKIYLGGYQLPRDTMVNLNGEKVLVMDKILDGVSIIERIGRQPYELEFDCILREYTEPGTVNNDGTSTVFPQRTLNDLWQGLWLPDTVQNITNTYLNGLGIMEMVVKSVTPTTYRGSKNVGFRISGYENVPGQTLILT